MGACTSCSSKNLLDVPINEFYANMMIRKTTCEKLSMEVKSCWSKGSISEETWNNKLVKELLGNDLEGKSSEEYYFFWTSMHKLYDPKILILASLLLCERNQNDFKQRFKDLSRGILKFKDSLIEVSDGLTMHISKDLLIQVLNTYVSLVSAQSLKYCEKIREDDTKGMSDLVKMYDKKYILEYVKELILNTEIALTKENKRKPAPEEFVDFDDFFEQTYHSLLTDDIQVRQNLELFSTSKLNKS